MHSARSAVSAADLATVGAGRVHTALGLAPAWRRARAVGPAFTVKGVSGDNLALHHALVKAPRGSVIVASLDGNRPAGHWGELMCVAAQVSGIAGLVVDGTVRDIVAIESREFPVFHDGTSPAPATKEARGHHGIRIEIRGAVVETGDLIVADADGITIAPAAYATELLKAVTALEERERELVVALGAGETTIRTLGLPESTP